MVPMQASAMAVHLRQVNGSRQKTQASSVTMIGALHWITVDTDAPLVRIARIQSTWNVPTARPIPASQGRSRR